MAFLSSLLSLPLSLAQLLLFQASLWTLEFLFP